MKWFDSLKKIKDTPTKLTGDDDVTQNLNKKSHRDIGKRTDFINLSRGVFHEVPDKNLGFSLSRIIDFLATKISQMLSSMTRGRWIVCIFLIFLGYIVYGLGFLIRTESNIQSLIDNPAQIVTDQGQHTVRKLFQDYQLIGVIAKNPIFPIEPLASYGYFLDYVRDFTATLNHLLGFKEELYAWYTGDGTQNIFSLLENMFPYFSELSQESAGMMSAFGNLTQSTRMEEIDTMKHSLDAFIAHKDVWYDLLGKNKLSRILLLNQNSDELRAGGGFPGTAFIIEFDGGKVTRFQFYDIYALDWLLKGYRPSPEGINRFRSREYPGKPAEFEIRDANYFPTFQESATKIDEFTRAANIGNIDLVIGVNQKFLEDIIKIVEPVNLPGIQVPIDHYNAMLILSMLVEGKKSLTEESPKGTVKTLGKVIFDTLQSQNKINQAFYVLASHILQGEVVAGSPRPDIQKALDDVGIFDRWRGKRGDWVYPLFTSISRNKSDRLMERTFEIDQVSMCERTLTLSQKHWYDLTERNRIEDLARKLGMEDKIPLLLPVQGAGDNVQYLRFILPPGTKYLPQPKSAFSVLENTPLYTSIHGYETTSPGTTSILKIRYVLPDGYCNEKTEFFKQPGLRNTRFLVKKGDTIVYQTFYE